jgi:hypothetical protein
MQKVYSSVSYVVDIHPGSKKLYIIFAGIGGGVNIPVFEFVKSAGLFNENIIFIKDISKSWYLNGINSSINDVSKLTKFLLNEVNKIEPKDIIFVGNSMGGFAAILFHAMMQIGRCIVFSPQTFILEKLRCEYNDKRWPLLINPLNKIGLYNQELLNITALPSTLNSPLNVTIHVCSNHRLDFIHAKLFEKLNKAFIFEYRFGGHLLVKEWTTHSFVDTYACLRQTSSNASGLIPSK